MALCCLSIIYGPCGAGLTKFGNKDRKALKAGGSPPSTRVFESHVEQEPETEPPSSKQSAPVSSMGGKSALSGTEGGLDAPSAATKGAVQTSSSWYQLEDDGCNGCCHVFMIFGVATLLMLIIFLTITWILSNFLHSFGGMSYSTCLVVALVLAAVAWKILKVTEILVGPGLSWVVFPLYSLMNKVVAWPSSWLQEQNDRMREQVWSSATRATRMFGFRL
jgi:hypothetical protein